MNCSIACLLKIDSNLSIYSYIHKYIWFEAWEVIASRSFFLFLYFLFDMYVCVQRDEDRWRQGWFICLESSFIWGVYYGDFHVSTQKEFICPSYFDMKRRKIRKKKEVWNISFYFSNFIDRWNVLFFLISFPYLFIKHIQPRQWHVIPSWHFFLCRPRFFPSCVCVAY
jgi:hypothetical protein